MSRYTYQQERELLEMQAQLARLKIAAEYMQKRRVAEQPAGGASRRPEGTIFHSHQPAMAHLF